MNLVYDGPSSPIYISNFMEKSIGLERINLEFSHLLKIENYEIIYFLKASLSTIFNDFITMSKGKRGLLAFT